MDGSEGNAYLFRISDGIIEFKIREELIDEFDEDHYVVELGGRATGWFKLPAFVLDRSIERWMDNQTAENAREVFEILYLASQAVRAVTDSLRDEIVRLTVRNEALESELREARQTAAEVENNKKKWWLF